MATFNIDGPIKQIVTKEKVEIVSLSGGTFASPTAIAPSATAETLIVLASADADGQFQLSSSFTVGDMIEIYNADASHRSIVLLDENGNDVTSAALTTPNGPHELLGSIYRKLSTGSSNSWGRIS